jgi:haloacetate dehalogenase
MSNPDRREFLKNSMALALAPAAKNALLAPGLLREPEPGQQPRAEFFEGFKREQIKTSGATINTVYGGNDKGSPLLLLHGIPETHVLWRKVAPALARDYFLVITDLRGYGDSGKPAGGGDHFAYSKRAMAQDQVEVMKHLGIEKFALVGHDRGGRAAHRLALDHPEVLTKLVILDIVPTYLLYQDITQEFATIFYHPPAMP